jgi:hypothetical protein
VLPQVGAPLQHQPVGEAGLAAAQVVGAGRIAGPAPGGGLGQPAVEVGGAGWRTGERVEHAPI